MAQEVTITGVTAGDVHHHATLPAAPTPTTCSSLTLPSVTATVLAPSTLVSNTGQDVTAASRATLQGINGISNAFRTGSNSDGYAVTSVDVRFNVSGNGALTSRPARGGLGGAVPTQAATTRARPRSRT